MSTRLTKREAEKRYAARSSSQHNNSFNNWLIFNSIILDDGYSENSRHNVSSVYDSPSYSSSSYDSGSSYSSSDSSSSSSSCD